MKVEWIPVEERMPELKHRGPFRKHNYSMSDPVLTLHNGKELVVDRRIKHDNGLGGGFPNSNATHWAHIEIPPLPERTQ